MYRFMPLIVISAALAPTAFASEKQSDPVPVTFEHEFDAFESAEYDTGPLPKDSSVNIQFFIKSTGKSKVTIPTNSILDWADGVKQTFDSAGAMGTFEMLCDIDIVAKVNIDLWGAIDASYDVWDTTISMTQTQTFDPMLLVDDIPNQVTAQADDEGVTAYTKSLDIALGADLVVDILVIPRAIATVGQGRIETGDTVLRHSSGFVEHELSKWEPESLDLRSTYIATLDTELDMVLSPQLSVEHSWFGKYNVARFDHPVALVTDSVEERFREVDYSHGLPVLGEMGESIDAGVVQVGNLANTTVSLSSIGLVDVEGTISIEGSDVFTAVPDTFRIAPGAESNFIITFAPTAEEFSEATLVIQSNDPHEPERRIRLFAQGSEDPVDPNNPNGNTNISGEVRACGCNSTSSPMGALAFLPLFALALLRRRGER